MVMLGCSVFLSSLDAVDGDKNSLSERIFTTAIALIRVCTVSNFCNEHFSYSFVFDQFALRDNKMASYCRH